MKAKSIHDLSSKGDLTDKAGAPLALVKQKVQEVAQQLGVDVGKLEEVIGNNSQAMLLIAEALTSPPQVHVTIPPSREWTITFERNAQGQIEKAKIASV